MRTLFLFVASLLISSSGQAQSPSPVPDRFKTAFISGFDMEEVKEVRLALSPLRDPNSFRPENMPKVGETLKLEAVLNSRFGSVDEPVNDPDECGMFLESGFQGNYTDALLENVGMGQHHLKATWELPKCSWAPGRKFSIAMIFDAHDGYCGITVGKGKEQECRFDIPGFLLWAKK